MLVFAFEHRTKKAGIMPEPCVLLHSMLAFQNQRCDVLHSSARVLCDVLYYMCITVWTVGWVGGWVRQSHLA